MLEIRSIFIIISWISVIECKMEPFVVGGKNAKIGRFPHSVFMDVLCVEDDSVHPTGYPWICGGSIMNERITLTAAHCLAGCYAGSSIRLSVGNAHRKKGVVSTAYSYLLHESYDPALTANDIALVKLTTPFELNVNVKRVAVMKNPPYKKKAQIAGWGTVNEETSKITPKLKYINQYVWNTRECKRLIRNLPVGTVCASSKKNDSYSSRGDSGSALVVRGYIQIGIVSYKMPKVSKSLVVYTDTGYFYDWIRKNSRRLYCV